MKSIREIAKEIVSKMYKIRVADMTASCIRSEAEEIGSWGRPLALEVICTRASSGWRCRIEISKLLEDGRVVDEDDFPVGGANGPIRWDAVIEGIVDLASPYGTH